MKISRKFIYIKTIIVLRNVNWCGKLKSNYSEFELVFFDFVIDFIKEKNYNHLKLLFKQKNNSFIERLKKEKYVMVKEDVVFSLDKLLFLKFFLNNVFFVHKFNYIFKFNENEFFLDIVFVFDNIVFVVYKNNIYILNNTCLDLFSWGDDKFNDNLSCVFKDIDYTLLK